MDGLFSTVLRTHRSILNIQVCVFFILAATPAGKAIAQALPDETKSVRPNFFSPLLQKPAEPRAPNTIADTIGPSAIDVRGASEPAENYGEAPEEVGPQFLRSVTPLLTAGQHQFDYGIVYSLQEYDFPAVVGGNLVRADSRRRSFFTPLSWRYGWNEKTQLFASLPLGWADTEIATAFGDESRSDVGVGDLTFGVTKLVDQDSCTGTSTIVTMRAIAPTGTPVNPLVINSVGLGNGSWRFGTDVLRVRSIDPVVLFYGLGYIYSVPDDYQDIRIQLGHQLNYNFGVGFAVNRHVTLSTAFLGAYITETEIEGINLSNSDQEPLRVRLAATIAERCKIVEPFVTFGLTETAPSSELGIVWTR